MPDKNIIIAALIIGGATALGLLKRFSVDVGFDTPAGQGDIGFNFGKSESEPEPTQEQTDPSRSSEPEPQTPTPSIASDEPPKPSPVVPNYVLPYYPYYTHWPYYGWPYGPYWRGWHRGWGRPFRGPRPWLARF